MQIEQVKYILWAQDMDRALAFWRDVVGLEMRMESPHWSELMFGNAVVALHGGGDGSFRQTGLGIQVADITRACQEIADGGGAVRSGPEARPGEPIHLAECTDTEGNGFSVSQYVGG